jgi:hypothetical protein
MTALRMRDPTAEVDAIARPRRVPTVAVADATIGLFSIAKERSDEFLDALERGLVALGLNVLRFAKATHTKTAAEDVIASMVGKCDVVVAGLAD